MTSNPIRSVVVLCVDDEEAVRCLLETALEQFGYVALGASNGREALHLATQHRIDAIILDYRMPDMNGAEVALEMKRHWPDVPIILYSASSDLPSSTLTRVDAFVAKGERLSILVAVLQRLLGRPQPDARRFPRYPVRLPLAVIVNRSGESAVLSGVSSNLGEGGIGCTIKGNLVPGEFIQVQGSDSELDFSLESHAQVRYRKEEAYGFEFCDVTPQQRVDVQRLCQRLASA